MFMNEENGLRGGTAYAKRAVELGEHDVEDDDVVATRETHLQPGAPVGGVVDDPALVPQGLAQRLGQGALVLDQQKSHVAPVSARCLGHPHSTHPHWTDRQGRTSAAVWGAAAGSDDGIHGFVAPVWRI